MHNLILQSCLQIVYCERLLARTLSNLTKSVNGTELQSLVFAVRLPWTRAVAVCGRAVHNIGQKLNK